MGPKKICYHTPSLSSFAVKDVAILETRYQVKVFLFEPKRKWLTPWYFFTQLIFLLKNLNASAHVCQFAGYHSFLPSLLARFSISRNIIVVGGTDCVSFPEIGYGNFQKKLLGLFTCMSLKFSSAIIAVDDSLVESENNYSETNSKKQGFKNHCKKIKTPFKIIYNGYSDNFWNDTSPNHKTGDIISVAAGITSNRRYVLKGIDLLIELARRKPDLRITLVGGDLPPQINVPPNVTIIGSCNAERLRTLYSQHKFYAQLSISEGFPNSICEAMLCGCIPIGSAVAAIPKIIGEEGYLLNKRSVDELETLFNSIQKRDVSTLKPRERIMTNFSAELRKKEILAYLLKLETKTTN